MAQQPIELILLRQWASYLDFSVWIVDNSGDLLFYNEPAEAIVGTRFEEAGAINAADLADRFTATRLDGSPMPLAEIPIVAAMRDNHPAHGELLITPPDGIQRHINVSAFPVSAFGRMSGVVAMFWEPGPS